MSKLPSGVSINKSSTPSPSPAPTQESKPVEKKDDTDNIVAKYCGKPGHNPYMYIAFCKNNDKVPSESGYQEWRKTNVPNPAPPRAAVDVQKLLQKERPYTD